MIATALEVNSYAVEHWMPDDRGPGVTLAFTQDGHDGQLHLLLTEPLAWQLASRILALLDMPPITPDDERFEEI